MNELIKCERFKVRVEGTRYEFHVSVRPRNPFIEISEMREDRENIGVRAEDVEEFRYITIDPHTYEATIDTDNIEYIAKKRIKEFIRENREICNDELKNEIGDIIEDVFDEVRRELKTFVENSQIMNFEYIEKIP